MDGTRQERVRMNKFFYLGLVLVLGLMGSLPLTAAVVKVPPISVQIQSEPLDFSDQGPVIRKNRVLVPIRPVFESGYVQAKVHWDEEKQQVSIYDQRGDCVELVVGSSQGEIRYAQGNREILDLDSAPIIENGRVLLPLRALMETFEYYVVWQPSTCCVEIHDSLPAWRRLLPLAQWQEELAVWNRESTQKGECVPCLLKK